MARRLRWLIFLVVPAISIIVLLLQQSLYQPSLAEALPTGELRIGIDASNPPFAVTLDAQFTGLEIDLSYSMGERLNIPIRFIDLGYDGQYDALSADRVDVLIAAVPIDITRTGAVTYSLPYFNAGQVLLSDQGIASMSEMAEKRLSFEYGSVAHAIALEWLRRVSPYTLVPNENQTKAMDSVRLSNADAVLTDAVSARLYLKEHRSWKPSMSYVTDSLFAVVSRADRPLISRYIGETVEELLADGTVQRLIEKWL